MDNVTPEQIKALQNSPLFGIVFYVGYYVLPTVLPLLFPVFPIMELAFFESWPFPVVVTLNTVIVDVFGYFRLTNAEASFIFFNSINSEFSWQFLLGLITGDAAMVYAIFLGTGSFLLKAYYFILLLTTIPLFDLFWTATLDLYKTIGMIRKAKKQSAISKFTDKLTPPEITLRVLTQPWPFNFPQTPIKFNVAYGPDTKQPKSILINGMGNNCLDIYLPKHPLPSKKMRAVMWMHGGAWAIGSKNVSVSYPQLFQIPAQLNAVVFNINYRLAPEASMDEILSDILLALNWIRENGASWGADLNQLYVGGSSAGSHLACLVPFLDKQNQKYPIRGILDYFGVHDLASNGKESLQKINKLVLKVDPNDQKTYRKYSSTCLLKDLISSGKSIYLPNYIGAWGSLDRIVNPNDSLQFYKTLKKYREKNPLKAGIDAGIEMPGSYHGWNMQAGNRFFQILNLHGRQMDAIEEYLYGQ